MTDPSLKSEPSRCPACSGSLNRLPTVDGRGYLLMCTNCDYQLFVEPGAKSQITPQEALDEADAQRFRRLLAENRAPRKPDEWPEELLEDLPPDARRALEGTNPPPPVSMPPSGEVPGHVKRTLMDYGFAVDEDARGLRLRSPGGLRRPGTGDLSASEVVRLAAQLGGEPPAPEARRTCPSCEAVVPRSAVRCSWCDADLPPMEPAG